MELVLVWLHVSGNVFWIGAICATGVVLGARSPAAGVRAALALSIYRRLAVPAFLLSFSCGAVRLAMTPKAYLVDHHWMHGKLLCALVVIALHHVIGGRARRAAQTGTEPAGSTAALTTALAVAATLAAFFAILRFPN